VLEIGKKLRIPGIGDDKADIKSLFKQRLSNLSMDKWLLILDNADDEALWGRRANADLETPTLTQYLPQTKNGSIIITTRSRGVGTFLAGRGIIELDQMLPEEGVKMFQEALEKPDLAGDDTSMLTLTKKLAGLPLAIIQAASFLNMTQQSVQTYHQLLDQPEEDIIKLLSKDFGDPSRYPNAKNPIATTWLISFDHIRKHHAFAAQLLSTMACLHEKNIPRSLLLEANSEIDMIDAIAVLTGYSFVKRHTGSDSVTSFDELYDLHRLVQLAARNWLQSEGSLSDWTKDCLARIAELFPTRYHRNRDAWTIYLPHAQRICEDESVRNCPERYQLLEKMGLCFIFDGKYTDAVSAHTLVVKWRETMARPLKQPLFKSYNNLGEALNLKGDFIAAQKYLEKASTGLREMLGVEHLSTLTSMGYLASTYQSQGRWTAAEELEVQVMETSKRVLGPEHPDTLTSMANLASTYQSQGRWTAAEELEVQVMETRKRVLGPEHPDTLTSMSNLAFTWKDQGRNAEAISLMQECVRHRQYVLGLNHHHFVSSSKALAAWEGEQAGIGAKLIVKAAPRRWHSKFRLPHPFRSRKEK
jgi:tetratricopeptide (TPR) repeat protein